ncbi:MAG TPA: gliding motility-associated ABC transporter ATP-binding subunit GldA [Bacteroidales bacterium]|jgi:ABC-2 type transport system ATP-binding protein
MSITVSQITKNYGKQVVLNKVSFQIAKGEIVGLLGPNGAGKSTLMKILTCFIPPTSGDASIEGFDVTMQSMEVRRHIGYLPENNPLYLDMYVKEYLGFIAGIHKLGKDSAKRIADMISLTGLGPEQHKLIGTLSKGYRQRVGLAQALIHNPDVLILDEPTSGLDPNQLLEIRNLIKTIGKEKTVMISTHIMQEVEAICDRAIIIHQGNIVADDSTAHLSQFRTGIIITAEFDKQVEIAALQKIKGISRVVNESGNVWQLHAEGEEDIRPNIFNFAVKNGFTVLSLHREEQKLEEVFQQLTKK